MAIFVTFWAYLAKTQSKPLRILHLATALFVIIQILDSNKISRSDIVQVYETTISPSFIWMHVIVGIIVFLLSLSLTAYCLLTRGVKYFYPYLWGDFTQVKQDLRQMIGLSLPPASPKGLAACVQGLGLGALLLVALSGLSWFILFRMNVLWAPKMLDWHKNFTTLIVIYVFAHSAMGALHFVLNRSRFK